MEPDNIKYLKNLPLLKTLPHDVITELADQLDVCHITAGEILFHQGDSGNSLYIIKEGQIKVVATTGEGAELVLNQFGPGQFFGEMSLIDQQPRSAGAVALSAGVVLKLKLNDFQTVLLKYPAVILEITRSLSAKLRFAAAYIQKAIEWSEYVAAGNYNSAIGEIKTIQSSTPDADRPDEAQINTLISTFFQMVEGVKAREEELKRQVSELCIEIDHVKKTRQVSEITDTEYFRELQKQAEKIRKRKKTRKK